MSSNWRVLALGSLAILLLLPSISQVDASARRLLKDHAGGPKLTQKPGTTIAQPTVPDQRAPQVSSPQTGSVSIQESQQPHSSSSQSIPLQEQSIEPGKPSVQPFPKHQADQRREQDVRLAFSSIQPLLAEARTHQVLDDSADFAPYKSGEFHPILSAHAEKDPNANLDSMLKPIWKINEEPLLEESEDDEENSPTLPNQQIDIKTDSKLDDPMNSAQEASTVRKAEESESIDQARSVEAPARTPGRVELKNVEPGSRQPEASQPTTSAVTSEETTVNLKSETTAPETSKPTDNLVIPEEVPRGVESELTQPESSPPTTSVVISEATTINPEPETIELESSQTVANVVIQEEASKGVEPELTQSESSQPITSIVTSEETTKNIGPETTEPVTNVAISEESLKSIEPEPTQPEFSQPIASVVISRETTKTSEPETIEPETSPTVTNVVIPKEAAESVQSELSEPESSQPTTYVVHSEETTMSPEPEKTEPGSSQPVASVVISGGTTKNMESARTEPEASQTVANVVIPEEAAKSVEPAPTQLESSQPTTSVVTSEETTEYLELEQTESETLEPIAGSVISEVATSFTLPSLTMLMWTAFCVLCVTTLILGKRILFSSRTVSREPLGSGETDPLEIETKRNLLANMRENLGLDQNANLKAQAQRLNRLNQRLAKRLKRKNKLAPIKSALDNLKRELSNDVDDKISKRKLYIQSMKNLSYILDKNNDLKAKIDQSRYEHLIMIRNFVMLEDLNDLMRDIKFNEVSNSLKESAFATEVETNFLREQICTFKELLQKLSDEYVSLKDDIDQQKAREKFNEQELARLKDLCDELDMNDSVDDWKRKVSDKEAETDKYYKDYINNYYRYCYDNKSDFAPQYSELNGCAQIESLIIN